MPAHRHNTSELTVTIDSHPLPLGHLSPEHRVGTTRVPARTSAVYVLGGQERWYTRVGTGWWYTQYLPHTPMVIVRVGIEPEAVVFSLLPSRTDNHSWVRLGIEPEAARLYPYSYLHPIRVDGTGRH